jgi:hypothetical protein
LEVPLVTVSHKPILLSFAIVFGLVLTSARSNAQWWKPHTPIDFEECAENAERTATSKEMRASSMSECEAKFPGRRKPCGGYTYYDFMQNRHFDIAGPNPTPEELKRIDEQYTIFLDHQRRGNNVAAFTEKPEPPDLTTQQQSAPVGLAVPIPVPRPRIRVETAICNDDSISCGWSKLSAKVQKFKKTILGSAKKTNPG